MIILDLYSISVNDLKDNNTEYTHTSIINNLEGYKYDKAVKLTFSH